MRDLLSCQFDSFIGVALAVEPHVINGVVLLAAIVKGDNLKRRKTESKATCENG